MNKYVILIAVGVIIIGGGVAYRVFLLPQSKVPVITGIVRQITVTAKKNTWSFVPENIDVQRGDKIEMTVVNEDDYDHGIAIDAFGISQRMPALQTIKLSFVATQIGDFPFYCSVPCGEGDVEIGGKKVRRTHFDMVGKLHVRNIISKAQ